MRPVTQQVKHLSIKTLDIANVVCHVKFFWTTMEVNPILEDVHFSVDPSDQSACIIRFPPLFVHPFSPFLLIHFLDSTMSLVWYMTCDDRKGILFVQYSKSFTIVQYSKVSQLFFFMLLESPPKRKKQCRDDTKSNIYINCIYANMSVIFSYSLYYWISSVFRSRVIHTYKKVLSVTKRGKRTVSHDLFFLETKEY